MRVRSTVPCWEIPAHGLKPVREANVPVIVTDSSPRFLPQAGDFRNHRAFIGPSDEDAGRQMRGHRPLGWDLDRHRPAKGPCRRAGNHPELEIAARWIAIWFVTRLRRYSCVCHRPPGHRGRAGCRRWRRDRGPDRPDDRRQVTWLGCSGSRGGPEPEECRPRGKGRTAVRYIDGQWVRGGATLAGCHRPAGIGKVQGAILGALIVTACRMA